MSFGEDGLHQLLLQSAQGHGWKMLWVEPCVCCWLQDSVSLVIWDISVHPSCHELCTGPWKVWWATHAFFSYNTVILSESLPRVRKCCYRVFGSPLGFGNLECIWTSMNCRTNFPNQQRWVRGGTSLSRHGKNWMQGWVICMVYSTWECRRKEKFKVGQ